MKIAIVVGAFPTLAETFIINHVIGLAESGCDVTVLSLHQPSDKQTHEDVCKYKLDRYVVYLQPRFEFRSKYIKSILRIFNSFKIIFKCTVKNPETTLRILFGIRKNGFRSILDQILLLPVLGVSKNEFDIIHCHFGDIALLCLPYIHANPATMFLASFHGSDISRLPATRGHDVYEALFKNFDIFVANTEYTKKRAIGLGCPKE